MKKQFEKNLRLTIPDKYQSFLKDIKERILKAQYDALKAVNKELILLYWDIGKKL